MNNPLFNKLVMLIIGIFALLGIFFIAVYFINIYMPFIIGFIIAAISNPIVKLLRKIKLPRSLASLLGVLLVVASVALIFYLIFFLAKGQFGRLVSILQDLGKSSASVIKDSYEALALRYPKLFELSFEEFINSSSPTLSKALTDNTFILGGTLFSFAKSIPSMAFFLIITFISSYFISIEYDRIKAFISKHIVKHPRVKAFVERIKSSASLGFGSWVRAQLIVMVFLAIVASIGFLLIGYSHAFVMAIVLAVFDALPIFGSGAVLLPLTLYHLIFGRFRVALWHLLLYAAITVTRQLIEPRVIGNQIGINPLITLLTLYTGFRIAGIFGMIFGILLLVIIVSIFNKKFSNNTIQEEL